MATGIARLRLPLGKMKPLDRVQKKWVVQQLRRAASQKSMEGMQKYQEAIMEVLLSEGSKTELKSVRQYLSFLQNYTCLFLSFGPACRGRRHCYADRRNFRAKVLRRGMGTV